MSKSSRTRSEDSHAPTSTDGDMGPDPVWGLGLFAIGFILMGIGGAANWHWVFNIGETVLLIGVAVFIISMVLTSNKHEPVLERLKLAFRGDRDVNEVETPPPPVRHPKRKRTRRKTREASEPE